MNKINRTRNELTFEQKSEICRFKRMHDHLKNAEYYY